MQEIEPKLKNKVFNRQFFAKYAYVFIIALCLLFGVSYSLTFFVENKTVSVVSITTGALSVSVSDGSINATSLTVPEDNQEGMTEFVKNITVNNTSSVDGKYSVTLTRTSGLNLTDLSYALIINGTVQEIGNVPSNGQIIISEPIMAGQTENVSVRLWPKTTYTGAATTFVGQLTASITYLGQKAASLPDLAGKYANFNCSGNSCEVWRIVKVENGRLVLTRQADYSGATSRVDSGKYNPSLSFNDTSLISSVSTDNKNVYLVRSTKIVGGTGTLTDPYDLAIGAVGEPDKKVVAIVTYKNGSTTVATQKIYYGETNYVSHTLTVPGFIDWQYNNTGYVLGDTISFASNIIMNAHIEIHAVSISVDSSTTGTGCNNSQCEIEALYDMINS